MPILFDLIQMKIIKIDKVLECYNLLSAPQHLREDFQRLNKYCGGFSVPLTDSLWGDLYERSGICQNLFTSLCGGLFSVHVRAAWLIKSPVCIVWFLFTSHLGAGLKAKIVTRLGLPFSSASLPFSILSHIPISQRSLSLNFKDSWCRRYKSQLVDRQTQLTYMEI